MMEKKQEKLASSFFFVSSTSPVQFFFLFLFLFIANSGVDLSLYLGAKSSYIFFFYIYSAVDEKKNIESLTLKINVRFIH